MALRAEALQCAVVRIVLDAERVVSDLCDVAAPGAEWLAVKLLLAADLP
jgi:hypothetical protein